MSSNIEKLFSETIAVLEKYKRKAYIPKTKEVSSQFSAKSKFGGFPYLRTSTDWPVCPNCKKNMQLFLQLNLNDLPEKKSNGLVQLFYCTTIDPHCESDLDAFFPFSKSVECRKIDISADPIKTEPEIDEVFQEKEIIGWIEKDDYPHSEEFELLGIDLEIEEEVYTLMEERNIGLTIQDDKLFGWPYWVQSNEYPNDRKTNKQMELLFQLESEDNLPYMFGDAGIGHLTQSPDNENELGFGWACA
ncbi:MAG: DUF1963 domain-containing protein [Bacteroidia bacterium]|nr:DUF1963 domain-containing protein [Bacteroidia bacterium]